MRFVGEFGVLETSTEDQRPALHLMSAKNALFRPTPNAALTHSDNQCNRTHSNNTFTNRG